MDLNEVMASNLRRIRHGKKLTQEELAHRTGLSTRHIGAIERAEMSATLTVLGQISEALDVDPREFLAKTSPT
ncbi:transcriptional regulator with XRE-family HTH domain [Rhizobium sp. BK077]|uniref:helix-turn-helix domain-containing protein n=1 Tax=Rhizobiaceae TaxID=82115 RepID=UPI0003FADF8A|nr:MULTISPECIES: helix-turn-helix transcriptional regulator [Rhizobium/Agrobacterium group]MBB3302281.1 transcriptional regulator with XRE-family HTH domain [Rhizobium sp. BK112]MBB3371403.1 transcriptional regulator with XRE-family HTH domain [Rhizobium sp. BK077]MBB4182108.1 transcriptional regulator with XRE-family HTH domain [Rhizobium sp. BK109]MBB4255538.1 transcriptional regulator with XRE-family HTH domain [Rhizobium sp. BK008]MDH0872646.1 helix-turn-helix transcriptional regulator [Ag